jgi:hypothetical protein
MGPARSIKNYKRIMNSVDVAPEVKHQIIENCAKYATFRKIKTRRYNIIAVVKPKADFIK